MSNDLTVTRTMQFVTVKNEFKITNSKKIPKPLSQIVYPFKASYGKIHKKKLNILSKVGIRVENFAV